MKYDLSVDTLAVILYMIGLSESTPATVCRTSECLDDLCRSRYQLKVQNRYDGQAWLNECSPDKVFCVYGFHFIGVSLSYQNNTWDISSRYWRGARATTDRWCRGSVYWFHV